MVYQLIKSRSARRHWPLALVLLYWAVRLHNLDALPIFLDEAAHLDWSRLVWLRQPFHAASDGKLLSIWVHALFWPFAATAWIGRVSTLLVTTLGFAALLAITKNLFSRRAAAFAGMLYIVVPFAMFFERMALPDAFTAAFTVLLVWSSLMLVRNPDQKKLVFLTGFSMAANVLSKVPNLVFAYVPALAAILFRASPIWRLQWRAVVRSYMILFWILLPLYAVLRWIVFSDMGLDLISGKSMTFGDALLNVGTTVGVVIENYRVLLSPQIIIPIVLSSIVTLTWYPRPGLYLALAIFPYLGLTYLGTSVGFIEARFAVVSVSMLLILTAGGFERALLYVTGRGPIVHATSGIVLVLLLLPSLGFVVRAWSSPEQLGLPQRDKWEYVTGWPSGYGFREIAEDYEPSAALLQLVTLDLGGRQRLQAYLPPDSLVTPVWISLEDFEAGVRPEAHMGRALLVLDHPKDDHAIERLDLSLAEIGRYPRPGGESWLTVYEFR